MILIDALPAFTDNYLWLLQEPLSKRCAVVDPGDAAPVLAWLAAHPGWQLTDILVTHHHPDHVGGVLQLKAHCGARVHGPAKENIPGRDVALNEGDCIEVLGLQFRVLEVPGHTLGHIAYYHAVQDLLPPCGYPPTHIAASPLHRHAAKEPLLFCGDTLFAGGCGRLFEGTPAQMHHSLQRLAQLPSNCLIYCTHEYTLSNLHFAHTVEPHNSEIAARLASVVECRAKGRSTLPSNMALEHATNPFLRCHEQEVKQRVDQRDDCQHASAEAVFASLRAWKNQF